MRYFVVLAVAVLLMALSCKKNPTSAFSEFKPNSSLSTYVVSLDGRELLPLNESLESKRKKDSLLLAALNDYQKDSTDLDHVISDC